jgi:hypothetical protein
MPVQEVQLGSIGNYVTIKTAAKVLGKSERAMYQAVRLNTTSTSRPHNRRTLVRPGRATEISVWRKRS